MHKGKGLGKKVFLGFVSLLVAIQVAVIVYSKTPAGQAAAAERRKEAAEITAQQREATAKQQAEELELEKQRIEEMKKNAFAAADLVGIYKRNEVSADIEFKGRPVVVRGRVGRIAKDILNTSYITLDEPEYGLGSIQCMFKEGHEVSLMRLHPGQSVYVRGTVSGKMMNVLLKDCSLLE